jgi:hypothetical protein
MLSLKQPATTSIAWNPAKPTFTRGASPSSSSVIGSSTSSESAVPTGSVTSAEPIQSSSSTLAEVTSSSVEAPTSSIFNIPTSSSSPPKAPATSSTADATITAIKRRRRGDLLAPRQDAAAAQTIVLSVDIPANALTTDTGVTYATDQMFVQTVVDGQTIKTMVSDKPTAVAIKTETNTAPTEVAVSVADAPLVTGLTQGNNFSETYSASAIGTQDVSITALAYATVIGVTSGGAVASQSTSGSSPSPTATSGARRRVGMWWKLVIRVIQFQV